MKKKAEELGLFLAMLNTGHGGALAGNPSEASMNTGNGAAKATCPLFDSDAPQLTLDNISGTSFPMNQNIRDYGHTVIFESTRYGMSGVKEDAHEKA
ncbi:hypothetical protein GKT60_17455 [Salmonella enterica]|nr:hypothetical protein [Salmonella enterica]